MITVSKDFKDLVIKLGNDIKIKKDKVTCEENTKNWLIIPWIELLGYDTRSPEVTCEYTRDVLGRHQDKIDYAILDNEDNPIILIEAKDARNNLSKENKKQLQGYFNIKEKGKKKIKKLAILTNGIFYHLYSDFEDENLMDLEPFHIIDMLNLTEEDFIIMSLLKKEIFNMEYLRSHVGLRTFASDFKTWLHKQAKDVSDGFIEAVIGDDYFSNLSNIDTNAIASVIKRVLSEELYGVSIFSTDLNLSNESDLSDDLGTSDKKCIKTSTGVNSSGIYHIDSCTKNVVTGKRVIGFVFGNEFISANYWTDIFNTFCEKAQANGINATSLCDKSDGVFKDDDTGFRVAKTYNFSDNTTVYYETNLSSESTVKTMKRLLDSVDIGIADIYFVLCDRAELIRLQKKEKMTKEQVYEYLNSNNQVRGKSQQTNPAVEKEIIDTGKK